MDSDYVRDMDDRRSTGGYVHTLSRRPICWNSTVQSIVAMSTTEACWCKGSQDQRAFAYGKKYALLEKVHIFDNVIC